MKRIFTVAAVLMMTASVWAQSPEKMSYQAVVRNSSNQLMQNNAVGMRISILQGTTTGTAVYVETHTPTTNGNGSVTIEIGNGTVVSGSFPSIDWGNGPYFIQTEIDPQGAASYSITGVSQLLSVPYALHSKTAESITGTVNYTETDPVFGVSVANGITAIDTANWNAHTIDTDTQLDSTDISAMGYIAGTHSIDSISANGDTLYLSNGQTFVSGGNSSGTGNLVFPTITTNTVTGITSNSATFGSSISNANDNQIMERGIVYSTSPNPTVSYSPKIMIGSSIAPYDTVLGLNYGYQHLLSANTAYYVRAYAITENNISFYGNEVNFTTLSVGQVGPGGGIVFFDKGNATGGWQYLESAVSDQSTGAEWGCHGTANTGADGTAVGTGNQNTIDIEAECPTVGTAADICANLTLGGYSDWFLPSKSALNLMYVNHHQQGVGGFAAGIYWSSTEDGNNGVGFYFDLGSPTSIYKYHTHRVRAVRAF